MSPMQQAIRRVSRLTKHPKPHLLWSSAQDRWTIGNCAPSKLVDCLRATRFSDSRPMPYNTRDSSEAVHPLHRWSNFRECTGCMGHGIKYGVGGVGRLCNKCNGTGKPPEAPNGIWTQPYVELSKN